MPNEKFFTKQLMRWNSDENTREMPWKNEKDPYKIWISEIILQQTRVNQGLEYYKRFIAKYPTVKALAAATETEVFKMWEGLGYYTRCRNIIASAKYISEDLSGIFPDTYNDILQLKGVGSYTASAIASFAYNLPHAVLDGNVFRVLARFFGINIPIDHPEGKKHFGDLANKLLDKKNPGTYNQAIMDFGATICKPLPLCDICPLNNRCVAYLNGWVQQLPVKEKVIIKRNRWLYYLVIEHNKKFYVRKRTEKDIWQNLYEFILVEMPAAVSIKKLQQSEKFKLILGETDYKLNKVSVIYKQQLTHQTIHGQFISLSINALLTLLQHQLISKKQVDLLPFPKLITTWLKD